MPLEAHALVHADHHMLDSYEEKLPQAFLVKSTLNEERFELKKDQNRCSQGGIMNSTLITVMEKFPSETAMDCWSSSRAYLPSALRFPAWMSLISPALPGMNRAKQLSIERLTKIPDILLRNLQSTIFV